MSTARQASDTVREVVGTIAKAEVRCYVCEWGTDIIPDASARGRLTRETANVAINETVEEHWRETGHGHGQGGVVTRLLEDR